MATLINTRFLAGKSTLLQILAGKRLITSEDTQVLMMGCDVFRQSPPGVTYLGTEWEVLSEEIACGHVSQLNATTGR
jgi:hypothetical protein